MSRKAWVRLLQGLVTAVVLVFVVRALLMSVFSVFMASSLRFKSSGSAS